MLANSELFDSLSSCVTVLNAPRPPSTFVHVLIFGSWIVINLSLFTGLKAFDPFPFSFLSLFVSVEAIFLTLFVLTSQNRQRTRDRIRSDIEFETAINTETKIAYLHEKIDRLTEGHYELMVGMQKLLTGSDARTKS